MKKPSRERIVIGQRIEGDFVAGEYTLTRCQALILKHVGKKRVTQRSFMGTFDCEVMTPAGPVILGSVQKKIYTEPGKKAFIRELQRRYYLEVTK